VQEIALFSMLAVAIVLFQDSSALTLTVLLAIALVAFSLWHDQYDRWCFVVVAVFGTCAEVFFVHYGVWRYANPAFLGIPLWFPVAFGTSALIGERLIRTVTQTGACSQNSKE
jgi:uncharacterized membrane protein YoaT (DUF817 family)